MKRKLSSSNGEGKEEKGGETEYNITESKMPRPKRWYCSNDPFFPLCSNTPPAKWIEAGEKGEKLKGLYEPFEDKKVCEYKCREETRKNFMLKPGIQQLIGGYVESEEIPGSFVTSSFYKKFAPPEGETKKLYREAGVDVETMFPEILRHHMEEQALLNAYDKKKYDNVLFMLQQGIGVTEYSLENLLEKIKNEPNEDGNDENYVIEILEPKNEKIMNLILTDEKIYRLIDPDFIQNLLSYLLSDYIRLSFQQRVFNPISVLEMEEMKRMEEEKSLAMRFIKNIIDMDIIDPSFYLNSINISISPDSKDTENLFRNIIPYLRDKKSKKYRKEEILAAIYGKIIIIFVKQNFH